MISIEEVMRIFNEICRGLVLNEGILLSTDKVIKVPAWGPMDPLVNTNVVVQFREACGPGKPDKFLRLVFKEQALADLINEYFTQAPLESQPLYNCVLNEYRKFQVNQGPGEDSEKDLTTFYQEFDKRGETYNNTIRIFFTACKMIKKYKNIILIPRSFNSFAELKDMISYNDPLGIKPPKKTFYFFKTDILSNIAAGQNFPPTTEFKLRLTDFDPVLKNDDPEAIKPLIGKADEITYAAARVMCRICQQLKNPG